jgi:hypothetical protein
MAFRKIGKQFSDEKIAGFWTRQEGQAIEGTLVSFVDTVNVKYPFWLIRTSANGVEIVSQDSNDGKPYFASFGSLVGLMDSAALKPLHEVKTGATVRIEAKGEKPCEYTDDRGRKVPGKLRLFDVYVDEEEPPQAPEGTKPTGSDDDIPF